MSARPRSLVLVLLSALAASASTRVARADDAAAKVATYELRFEGEVSEGVRAAVAARVLAGLAASGMRVMGSDEVKGVLGKRSCTTARCLKKLWVMLGSRYVVGGTVKGADRTYDVTLWVSDARNAKRLSRSSADVLGLRRRSCARCDGCWPSRASTCP